MSVSPGIKALLGFEPDTDDEVINREWKKRAEHVCKPCWELKYCPYGPLVEQFPLPPPLTNYLKRSCRFVVVGGPSVENGRHKEATDGETTSHRHDLGGT
jgi:hypothetical protein